MSLFKKLLLLSTALVGLGGGIVLTMPSQRQNTASASVANSAPSKTSKTSETSDTPDTSQGPNILLIVADDMGYSDSRCFGGEIDTPSIDLIAAGGARFTNFFVNPMCTVTRTSLLTGHEHSQSDHYRRSIPFPKLLRESGYRNSISGKWHQPGHPLDAGFTSFYGFLKGEINGWLGTDSNNKTLAIARDRNSPQKVSKGWYCSDAFADDAIAQMKTAVDSNTPFFAYVPFNAPHGPLHAPKENVTKYAGRFDEGWDALGIKRMQRMRSMGIIDSRYQPNVPEAETARWDELAPVTQTVEANRFCAYAGMVDRMDYNIGRLLTFLDQSNIADNTIVIFFSDNGGNYSHGTTTDSTEEIPWKPLGPRPACATGWGRLMNTPFSWYKTSTFRGGVSSPLIVRWPQCDGIEAGSILRHRVHVSDIYPTLLEIIGKEYPAALNDDQAPTAPAVVKNKKLPPQPLPPKPLYGRSFLPLLNDPRLPLKFVRNEIFWGFRGITKGLLRDDWKISTINDSPWKLYDLQNDPAESTDLAAQHPQIVEQLNDRWFAFADNETDMPPAWKKPLNADWQGWGLHRVRMTMPLRSITPACSQTNVSLRTPLKMTFDHPIDFEGTDEKFLCLYAVGDPEKPAWLIDPTANHSGQGQTSVTFSLPRLKPATTYYLVADRGWIKVNKKPAIGLNDKAFFYRFRTGNE